MTKVGVCVVAVATAILGGCEVPNPAYCYVDDDCATGLICSEGHACVAAPDADLSCTADDDCESRVCTDGACEATDRVRYVAPDGIAAGTCSQAAPCELTYALSQIDERNPAVRLGPGSYALPAALDLDGSTPRVVVVGGRTAVLSRTGAGPLLVATGGTNVTLRGMTITRGLRCGNSTLTVDRVAFDEPGADPTPWLGGSQCAFFIVRSSLGHANAAAVDITASQLSLEESSISASAQQGIRIVDGSSRISRSVIDDNLGVGIDSTAASLVVERSTIALNRGGGISVATGNAQLTNNFVYRNGNPGTAAFGGIFLGGSDPDTRVEHNTIAHNEASFDATPIRAGGIYCAAGTLANNLVYNNYRGNNELPGAQVGGACATGTSLVDAGDNGATNPFAFVSPIDFPFDYHLRDDSSRALGAATPGIVTVDIDGESRTLDAPDLGADELAP